MIEKSLFCRFNLDHIAGVTHVYLHNYWSKPTRKELSFNNTLIFKAAVTDIGCFAKKKFLGKLVDEKNFALILQVARIAVCFGAIWDILSAYTLFSNQNINFQMYQYQK